MPSALKILRRRLFSCAVALFFAAGAVKTLAQRPLGCDISGYQPSVNWSQVTGAGVKFCWTKATEGTGYTSSSFASQESGAKAAGVFVGAYHFARPSANPNITGANSADSEANYFWGVAGGYITNGGAYLVPMLDWEDPAATNGHNGFNGYTTSYMSQWVNEWCNTVSNLAQAKGVTIRPLIYTGTWYSNPLNGYAGLDSSVTNRPVWIASYNGQNPQTGGPTSATPWATSAWNFWQYNDTNTSVVNWGGGDVDVFNGNISMLVSNFVIGGIAPPSITAQPLWRATDTGGSVTFSAAAGGTTPLSYQWTFAGANIPGATSSTYTLTGATTNNTGNYALVVTNVSGSATSSPSWLLVYPPQATVFADNFDVNTATNWTYNKSSADNSATFAFDYSALGIPAAPNATNGTTRGLQMKANLSLTTAAAVSLSPTNRSFSGDYRLHFDTWINVNGPFPGGGAGSTEFLTGGLGTAGNRVEWTGSGTTADGYYFAVDGDGGVSAGSTTSGDYQVFSNATLLATSSGAYIAGTDTTVRDNANPYYLTAIPGGLAAPALQQSTYAQQTGNLAAGSFGFAWHDVIVSKRGNTVDWIVDGVRLASMPNCTFTSSSVAVGFWDYFSSLSDNNAISFGLVDNVRVEQPATVPQFTSQPVAQTVPLGTNVTFAATTSALPAANYQWRFNGTNILGATNSTYALAFVAQTNRGNYSVIATNIAGSITSTNAMLALVSPVAAQFASVGLQNGALSVGFGGTPYWTYTVEVSSNLTDWNPLTNMVSTNGTFNFASAVTNAPQQFFRARVGP
jgi:GH25 family lysozyme M1 (1,4-beta-N-acetylmuramidase)